MKPSSPRPRSHPLATSALALCCGLAFVCLLGGCTAVSAFRVRFPPDFAHHHQPLFAAPSHHHAALNFGANAFDSFFDQWSTMEFGLDSRLQQLQQQREEQAFLMQQRWNRHVAELQHQHYQQQLQAHEARLLRAEAQFNQARALRIQMQEEKLRAIRMEQARQLHQQFAVPRPSERKEAPTSAPTKTPTVEATTVAPAQTRLILVRDARGQLFVRQVPVEAPTTQRQNQPTQSTSAAQVQQAQREQPTPVEPKIQSQSAKPVEAPATAPPSTKPQQALLNEPTPTPALASPPASAPITTTAGSSEDDLAEDPSQLVVHETDSSFLVSLPLPDVSSQYVHVEIRGNTLVLTGERHYEDKVVLAPEEVGRIGLYGFVRRRWKLPTANEPNRQVDVQNVEAVYDQARQVLTVRLLKLSALASVTEFDEATRTKVVGGTIFIPLRSEGQPPAKQRQLVQPEKPYEDPMYIEDADTAPNATTASITTAATAVAPTPASKLALMAPSTITTALQLSDRTLASTSSLAA